MSELKEELAGKFVLANLGAAGDANYRLPSHLRRCAISIEVDAATGAATDKKYLRKCVVSKVVAGADGRRPFRLNRARCTSSLLTPNEEAARPYGLAAEFQIEKLLDVDCISLPSLMRECRVPAIDFLKTDLEGADFEVLTGMGELLGDVICIQCELRFSPMYHGEPPLYEVLAYLDKKGFEVVGLEPEYWRPITRHVHSHIDGHIAHCDVLLFRRLGAGHPPHEPLQIAKHILIACMLGERSHGEFVLESYRSELPPAWVAELQALVKPKLRYLVGRSLMAVCRFVMRFGVRRFTCPHIVKGVKDKFYLGGW